MHVKFTPCTASPESVGPSDQFRLRMSTDQGMGRACGLVPSCCEGSGPEGPTGTTYTRLKPDCQVLFTEGR